MSQVVNPVATPRFSLPQHMPSPVRHPTTQSLPAAMPMAPPGSAPPRRQTEAVSARTDRHRYGRDHFQAHATHVNSSPGQGHEPWVQGAPMSQTPPTTSRASSTTNLVQPFTNVAQHPGSQRATPSVPTLQHAPQHTADATTQIPDHPRPLLQQHSPIAGGRAPTPHPQPPQPRNRQESPCPRAAHSPTTTARRPGGATPPTKKQPSPSSSPQAARTPFPRRRPWSRSPVPETTSTAGTGPRRQPIPARTASPPKTRTRCGRGRRPAARRRAAGVGIRPAAGGPASFARASRGRGWWALLGRLGWRAVEAAVVGVGWGWEGGEVLESCG